MGQSDSILASYNNEIYHYGVIGMKWGVRRARSKMAGNSRLERKALNYDKKAAVLGKKSEKIHAKEDLGRANRAASKAGKYSKKAAILEKKSLKSKTDMERLLLLKRSENLKYKSTKATIKSNRIAKTQGYGLKAMKYSVKSDKAAAKAAKARKMMASNEVYIARMKQKVSSITPEQRQNGYEFVNALLTA